MLSEVNLLNFKINKGNIRLLNKHINILPSDTQSGTTAVGDQAPFSSQLNVFTGSPSVNLQKHNAMCITLPAILDIFYT
jgi:hypothetical protein